MILEYKNDKFYRDGVEIDETTFNTLFEQFNNGITITNEEEPIAEDISIVEDVIGEVLYTK